MATEKDSWEKALEKLAEEYTMQGDFSSLEAFFQYLDLDGNGTVEVDELQVALKQLGAELSQNSVRKLMESVGTSDALTFEQFQKIVNERSRWERALQGELEDLCKEAQQHAQQNELSHSIEIYEEVVRRDPTHIPALSALGAVLHSAGSLQKAKQNYEAVLALEPNRAKTIYNLGRLAHDVNDLPAAQGHYERVIQLDSDPALACNALAFLGLLHLSARRLPEAQHCFTASLTRSPQHLRTLCHQAALLQHQGSVEAAAAQHSRVVALDSRHAAQRCPYKEAVAATARPAAAAAAEGKTSSSGSSLVSPSGSKSPTKGGSWLKRIGSSFRALSLEHHIRQKEEERSRHGLSRAGSAASGSSTKL